MSVEEQVTCMAGHEVREASHRLGMDRVCSGDPDAPWMLRTVQVQSMHFSPQSLCL